MLHDVQQRGVCNLGDIFRAASPPDPPPAARPGATAAIPGAEGAAARCQQLWQAALLHQPLRTHAGRCWPLTRQPPGCRNLQRWLRRPQGACFR